MIRGEALGEKLARNIAWLLPRRIAYHAFIRVYAATQDAPGPEFEAACKSWFV